MPGTDSTTVLAGRAVAPRLARSKARRPKKAPANEVLLDRVFAELARVAEMSTVERRLGELGFRCIAGTDEVGRGCLAGPVVAACVILDRGDSLFRVNDSKLLGVDERVAISRLVLQRARAVGVGVVEPQTIDRINILQASKLAMAIALENLSIRPEVLLLDAVTIEALEIPQVPLIAGDRRSLSIAAASVVAKVYRDFLMESYHERYPVYGFRQNRGYATEDHQAALRVYGPSPIHRRSFDGVEEPMMLFGSGEDGEPER